MGSFKRNVDRNRKEVNMNKDKLYENRMKEIDYYYKKDIVYKSLVDNYIMSSIRYDSGKASMEEYINAFNGLACYEEKMTDNARLEIVKSINFTNEDIAEMFKHGIFSTITLNKMFEIKYSRGEN